MERTENVVKNDRFAEYVGIRIVRTEPGYAVTEVELGAHHKNGLGMVQGGVMFTLADIAFAAAANAGGTSTVSIVANISYFRPPAGNRLTAEAREVSSSGRICNYSVDVFDEAGSLAARVSVTGCIKR